MNLHNIIVGKKRISQFSLNLKLDGQSGGQIYVEVDRGKLKTIFSIKIHTKNKNCSAFHLSINS